jgi:hypothetical protein
VSGFKWKLDLYPSWKQLLDFLFRCSAEEALRLLHSKEDRTDQDKVLNDINLYKSHANIDKINNMFYGYDG